MTQEQNIILRIDPTTSRLMWRYHGGISNRASLFSLEWRTSLHPEYYIHGWLCYQHGVSSTHHHILRCHVEVSTWVIQESNITSEVDLPFYLLLCERPAFKIIKSSCFSFLFVSSFYVVH